MGWNNDGLHDLLVGDAAGNVHIFLNTNNNTNPVLDSGSLIQVSGSPIDVGIRATPIVDDWNEDGKKDLLVGNLTGNIQIYLNEGTDAAPVFNSSSLLQVGGVDFDIGSRAAPRIFDWDEDGLKDLLVGETQGYVYFLENVGTNNAPAFDGTETLLLANGDPLQYPAPRSFLDVADWNNDGFNDILLGGADGKVMVFQAAPEPLSSTLFLAGSGVIGLAGLRRRFKAKGNMRNV